jgi:hypothetical protein
MILEDAIAYCHVRSAIYRKADPNKKYWKNSIISLREQIPANLHRCEDWEEFDPRDEDRGSLFMFND